MRILLIHILLLLGIVSLAQTATIRGRVIDKDGSPLEGSTITERKTGKTEITNSLGRYEIEVPAVRDLTLAVSYGGKFTSKSINPLKSGELKLVNFQLNVVYTTKEFVKRVEYNRTQISAITIDPKKLERFPTAAGFENNLKSIGLGISKAGGELSSAYSVRGGNFDENLVYVNDIEVYRPFLVRSGQQEGLSIINPDMVDNVEFSAGGFEARFGDKLSSALDIKYKKPDSFAATAHVSLLGLALHAEDRSKNGRFSYLAGVRYRTNQYLLGTLDVQGDYKPRFIDVQSLLSYRLRSDLTLSWLSTFSENRYLIVPESQQTNFGNVNSALQLNIGFGGSELMQYSTFMNGLNLEYKPNKYNSYNLITSAYNTHEREHFTMEGAYDLGELDRDLGSDNFAEVKRLLGFGYFIDHARNDLNAEVYTAAFKGKHIWKFGTTSWGTGFKSESIEDRLKEWRYNDSSGYNITTVGDRSDNNEILLDEFTKANINISSYRLSGYVQNSQILHRASNMRLVYGIRSNFWSFNEENVISPRLQWAFEPNKKFNDSLRINGNTDTSIIPKRDLVLKAAAGYYYQPPFYRELRNLEGVINPNLRAQQSIHFVLGGDLNFKAWDRPFKLVSEVYYKHLDRMVPYVIDNIRIRYLAENSSQGYAAGFDTRVNGEFIKGIESWFNFSLLSTRERINYTNDAGEQVRSDWLRRPTDQRVNFSILFQDELKRNPSYKVNMNLVFGSQIPYFFDGTNRFSSDAGFTLAPYRRVDIGFSKVLVGDENAFRPPWMKKAESLWMSLEVFNLLQMDNTISYILIKDFSNTIYGVPNRLTGRRLNLRFILKI